MGLVREERAQSVVIGSLLIFTILIVSFSVYQAFSVPNQNAQVEFNHYAEIQDDMQEVRQAHQSAVADGEPRSPALTLGTKYKGRIIAVNPPTPQGTLRSEDAGEFELQDASEAETGDSVTTDTVCGTPQVESSAIRYEPGYKIGRASCRERV